jgi:DNA-binding response OmpR family regulator
MTGKGGQTVFVAESDLRLLHLIELTLSAAGHAVVSVQRAAEALEQLQSSTPLLIVLGRLPDLNTGELAQRIRRVPRLQSVPLLLTDGSSLPQGTPQAASATLARPFTGTALKGAVEQLLGNPVTATPAAHTVMVIEDSAALRGLISDILHRQGFGVETAENVPQARALIRQHAADVSLILLDVNLPGGTGFELLELIRQRSTVPVFILSALRQQEQMLRGQALGAQAFIEKPFNPRELVQKIRETLTS